MRAIIDHGLAAWQRRLESRPQLRLPAVFISALAGWGLLFLGGVGLFAVSGAVVHAIPVYKAGYPQLAAACADTAKQSRKCQEKIDGSRYTSERILATCRELREETERCESALVPLAASTGWEEYSRDHAKHLSLPKFLWSLTALLSGMVALWFGILSMKPPATPAPSPAALAAPEPPVLAPVNAAVGGGLRQLGMFMLSILQAATRLGNNTSLRAVVAAERQHLSGMLHNNPQLQRALGITLGLMAAAFLWKAYPVAADIGHDLGRDFSKSMIKYYTQQRVAAYCNDHEIGRVCEGIRDAVLFRGGGLQFSWGDVIAAVVLLSGAAACLVFARRCWPVAASFWRAAAKAAAAAGVTLLVIFAAFIFGARLHFDLHYPDIGEHFVREKNHDIDESERVRSALYVDRAGKEMKAAPAAPEYCLRRGLPLALLGFTVMAAHRRRKQPENKPS